MSKRYLQDHDIHLASSLTTIAGFCTVCHAPDAGARYRPLIMAKALPSVSSAPWSSCPP